MDEEDWAKKDGYGEEESSHQNFALWAIFGAMIVIAGLLYNIADTLKDIYSDTHYTSASADYLKNIQDILEDIRNK